MQQIVDYTKIYGFEDALKNRIPKYLHSHLLSTGRADGRFFVGHNKDSIVLDLGCMWGGLTFALAEHCKKIIGLDQTLETLQLGHYRAQENGIQNVAFLGGDARKIPIKDNTFDVVILNGVLEWLGLDEEYVVEERWGRRSKKRVLSGQRDPRVLQLRGLREAFRVLTPGGTLYIAIENRIRAAYFFGAPDDHSGLPFNSLLPRRWANLYSLWTAGQPYRTFTYTARGLSGLLKEAGFSDLNFFTAYPTYERPETIFPLNSRLLEFYLMNEEIQSRGVRGQILNRFLCRTKLAQATVPNFIVLARKEKGRALNGKMPTFSEMILQKWEILFPGIERPLSLSLLKLRSRMEEGAPVSFLVFANTDETHPVGYLKVNRDKRGLKALRHEAEVYEKIYGRCVKSRNGLTKPMFCGSLAGYFIISRFPLNGHLIERRLFQDLDQRPERTATKANDFARAAYQAIEWLILFNAETRIRTLRFESFWDRFVASRFTSLATKKIFDVPDNLLRAYHAKLKKLAGQSELWLGPLHGDFNFYNILFSTEGIGIVDWEYAEEESFPIFDALNLFTQSAIEHSYFNRPYEIENLYSSGPHDELSSIAERLLSRYAECQGLRLEFVKACAPLFILDLLQRDYGVHEFPLRSPVLFTKLLHVVLCL